MEAKKFGRVNVALDFIKKVGTVDFGINTKEIIYGEYDSEQNIDNLLNAIFKLIDKESKNVHIDLLGQYDGAFSQEHDIKGYRFNSAWHGNDLTYLENVENGQYQDSRLVEYDSRIKMINALKKDIKATILENILFEK